MQGNSKYTLEVLDSKLEELSKHCFSIDRESRLVLGIIAKNGPISEYQIARIGKRRKHFKRDVVRYRILKSHLSKKNDFLSMKPGKQIGNIQKREKLYSLTFKGFLASLHECPIKNNFWIKNYLTMITKLTNETTAKEFLNHIYLHIVLFLILHARKVGILTTYENLEIDFYDEYGSGGEINSLPDQTQIKGIPIEFKEVFIDSLIPYFVSFNVVGNLLKNSLQLDYSSNDEKEQEWEYNEFVDKIFRRWTWSMFISKNITPKQILKKSEKHYDPEFLESIINVSEEFGGIESFSGSSMDFEAQDRLAEIEPNIEYDPYESLVDFD